ERAPAIARRVERHPDRLPSGPVHPSLVRGPGGTEAGGRGSGLWGRATHLPAVEPAGQPTGPLFAAAGGGSRGVGGDLRGTLVGDGGGPLGHSQSRRSLCAPG